MFLYLYATGVTVMLGYVLFNQKNTIPMDINQTIRDHICYHKAMLDYYESLQ